MPRPSDGPASTAGSPGESRPRLDISRPGLVVDVAEALEARR
ncbi:hypothetical protein [Tautonia marina]